MRIWPKAFKLSAPSPLGAPVAGALQQAPILEFPASAENSLIPNASFTPAGLLFVRIPTHPATHSGVCGRLEAAPLGDFVDVSV